MRLQVDRHGLTPKQRRKYAVCKKHLRAYCNEKSCSTVRKRAIKKHVKRSPGVKAKKAKGNKR